MITGLPSSSDLHSPPSCRCFLEGWWHYTCEIKERTDDCYDWHLSKYIRSARQRKITVCMAGKAPVLSYSLESLPQNFRTVYLQAHMSFTTYLASKYVSSHGLRVVYSPASPEAPSLAGNAQGCSLATIDVSFSDTAHPPSNTTTSTPRTHPPSRNAILETHNLPITQRSQAHEGTR